MTARTMLRTLLFALAAMLPAAPGGAKVGRVKLADLARGADCIVLARVEGVLSFDGLPVARAVPERTLKGDPGAGPFYFVAGKTWRCDVSAAVRGETVLLFLQRSPSGRIDRRLLRLPTANVPRTPLFRLADAGRGRMPVAGEGAEQRVTVPFDVELPAAVGAMRDPKNTHASAPQTVLLAAVVRALQPRSRPRIPRTWFPRRRGS